MWQQPQQLQERHAPHQRHYSTGDRSFRANTISDRSDSAQEVENMIAGSSSNRMHRKSNQQGGWLNNSTQQANRHDQRGKFDVE